MTWGSCLCQSCGSGSRVVEGGKKTWKIPPMKPSECWQSRAILDSKLAKQVWIKKWTHSIYSVPGSRTCINADIWKKKSNHCRITVTFICNQDGSENSPSSTLENQSSLVVSRRRNQLSIVFGIKITRHLDWLPSFLKSEFFVYTERIMLTSDQFTQVD